jgi:hypothetical protein
MGKTFRRGGNERGYYSPGKSLRDKRQRGGSNRNITDYDDSYTQKGKTSKSNIKHNQTSEYDDQW